MSKCIVLKTRTLFLQITPGVLGYSRSGAAMRPDFAFGVFELDLRARELRKHGVRVPVARQALEILIMLLEQPGEVVTREEICRRLWPDGTVVEFDHSVNVAVNRLRDHLGDSAATPRFVETLPRVGYRFLAQVEKNGGPSTPQEDHFAHERETAGKRGLTRQVLVAGTMSLLVLTAALFGIQWYLRFSRARWAEGQALPEVSRLMKEGQPFAALRLLRKAQQYALHYRR